MMLVFSQNLIKNNPSLGKRDLLKAYSYVIKNHANGSKNRLAFLYANMLESTQNCDG